MGEFRIFETEMEERNIHELRVGDDMLLHFVKSFTYGKGNFFYCENEIVFAETFLKVCRNNGWAVLPYGDIETGAVLRHYDFATVQAEWKGESLPCVVHMCHGMVADGRMVWAHGNTMVQHALDHTNHLVLIVNARCVFGGVSEARAYVNTHYAQSGGSMVLATAQAMLQPYRGDEHSPTKVDKNIYLFAIEHTTTVV